MYCLPVLTSSPGAPSGVPSDIDVLVRFGRALADPLRCRLLLRLAEAPAYPSDLADALGVSRTRLSNHLACLRDCGLVVAVPEGRRTRYELADTRLGHALDDLRGAVVTVAAGRSCPGAAEEECCP
ncbi:helix-turn-helix transcriptional regulator [Streptomyces sp. JJ36]|uniref:ArsR/SmtB family transcription factor n=1 Tax=Streptomyces sp. JJ36 TaxID=2736645 RepID=UPI001F41CBEC|nr:helix-turn-helix domain-containing protein [Streptomyces sp. JJ36]MCF6522700.1 helix-turn-helix transcriptional regulator [Streptomyces sp. JJ36]